MSEADEILDILISPAPAVRDVGAEGELVQFNDGFLDGWHGVKRRSARGIYGRAYRAGEMAKKESTYFKK